MCSGIENSKLVVTHQNHTGLKHRLPECTFALCEEPVPSHHSKRHDNCDSVGLCPGPQGRNGSYTDCQGQADGSSRCVNISEQWLCMAVVANLIWDTELRSATSEQPFPISCAHILLVGMQGPRRLCSRSQTTRK